MKPTSIVLLVLVILSAIGIAWIFSYAAMPAHALDCGSTPSTMCKGEPDTKYDGDCQPTDTVGRCADKPVLSVVSTPVNPIIVPIVAGFIGK